MGTRLLEISVELINSLLEGMTENQEPSHFKVTANGLPKDRRILSVRSSPYRANTVEVEIESPAWSDAAPRTKIVPEFELVTSITTCIENALQAPIENIGKKRYEHSLGSVSPVALLDFSSTNPTKLPEEEIEKVRKDFEEAFKNNDLEGKLYVTPPGVTVEPIHWVPESAPESAPTEQPTLCGCPVIISKDVKPNHTTYVLGDLFGYATKRFIRANNGVLEQRDYDNDPWEPVEVPKEDSWEQIGKKLKVEWDKVANDLQEQHGYPVVLKNETHYIPGKWVTDRVQDIKLLERDGRVTAKQIQELDKFSREASNEAWQEIIQGLRKYTIEDLNKNPADFVLNEVTGEVEPFTVWHSKQSPLMGELACNVCGKSPKDHQNAWPCEKEGIKQGYSDAKRYQGFISAKFGPDINDGKAYCTGAPPQEELDKITEEFQKEEYLKLACDIFGTTREEEERIQKVASACYRDSTPLTPNENVPQITDKYTFHISNPNDLAVGNLQSLLKKPNKTQTFSQLVEQLERQARDY